VAASSNITAVTGTFVAVLRKEPVMNNRVRAPPAILVLAMAAALLAGCGPTPEL
jgi:hypothetical protein